MDKIKISDLPPVAKTLLIPLSYRVVDNRRPDPMVKDPRVLELADRKAAYLFLAEGLLPYFAKTDVKRLVIKLKEHFPGSELIFDVVSRFHIQLHSLRSSNRKITSLLQWSPENIREIEAWDEEIRLLSIWNYFDKYEPRLGIFNSLKFIPFLRGISLILRYRLGGLVKDREVNHEPLELNNALYNKD